MRVMRCSAVRVSAVGVCTRGSYGGLQLQAVQMCEPCSPEERTDPWLTPQNAAKMERKGLTPTPWKGGPEMDGCFPASPVFSQHNAAPGSLQLTDDQERETPPLVTNLDCERNE